MVVFPFHPSADGSSGGEVRLISISLPARLPCAHDFLRIFTGLRHGAVHALLS